jgi:hypothetical protein
MKHDVLYPRSVTRRLVMALHINDTEASEEVYILVCIYIYI